MSSFDPLSAAFELGKTAIERIWPDPIRRAEELLKLERLREEGDLERLNAHVQLMLGQIETNKIEAQHPSLFIAGWRPGIGWVGVIALACAYIPKSLVMTAMWTYQCYLLFKGFDSTAAEAVLPALPPFPDLGISEVIGLLGSILGVGAMRSWDKKNRVETSRLGL